MAVMVQFVAPLVGAWIEILGSNAGAMGIRVAPLVGAWIEIDPQYTILPMVTVAPLVGAWIEIVSGSDASQKQMSLPSWERGLKLFLVRTLRRNRCRSPRGSVD